MKSFHFPSMYTTSHSTLLNITYSQSQNYQQNKYTIWFGWLYSSFMTAALIAPYILKILNRNSDEGLHFSFGLKM